MTRALAPLPGNPDGSIVTHAYQCALAIRDALAGAVKFPGRPFVVENFHTTASGTAAYFTDPLDGRRYRLTVEPINVFAGEDQEFRTPAAEAAR